MLGAFAILSIYIIGMMKTKLAENPCRNHRMMGSIQFAVPLFPNITLPHSFLSLSLSLSLFGFVTSFQSPICHQLSNSNLSR